MENETKKINFEFIRQITADYKYCVSEILVKAEEYQAVYRDLKKKYASKSKSSEIHIMPEYGGVYDLSHDLTDIDYTNIYSADDSSIILHYKDDWDDKYYSIPKEFIDMNYEEVKKRAQDYYEKSFMQKKAKEEEKMAKQIARQTKKDEEAKLKRYEEYRKLKVEFEGSESEDIK